MLTHLHETALQGMFYLHNRKPPVLHRDLKSANLLVDSKWQVKVCAWLMDWGGGDGGQGM